MSKIKNIEKFNKESVKSWKRRDFIKAFEGRFSNADVIYDTLCGKKIKKEEN